MGVLESQMLVRFSFGDVSAIVANVSTTFSHQLKTFGFLSGQTQSKAAKKYPKEYPNKSLFVEIYTP